MTVPAIVRLPLLIGALLAAAACGLAGSRPTPSLDAPSPLPSASISSAPSVEPTRTPPQATEIPPPSGFLTADGTQVEGWLGSYCWQDLCADAPEVPPKDQLPQVLGDGNELAFSLSDTATFITWRATYASESNERPTTLGESGEAFDPDARPSASPELLSAAEFDSPPAGDWVIFVQVFFDGGDLSYAWHVVIQ
jgi:hypothetical protein